MFSSGSTDRLQKPGKKMLGLDAIRTATNEMGVSIPWWCGRARVGVTYISRIFNVITTKVKSSGKGGKTTAYKYTGSFAAVVGFGPMDRLFHVIASDDLLWSEDTGSPTARPGAGVNYVDVAVENLGTLRVYWGTETQVADTGLVYDGIEHPAYRGFCYVRSLSWNLGQFSGGDVPAPNLEIMAGRYPVPSWWVLPSVKIGQDINAAAAIWDLLSPKRKNGIKPELIDTDSLISVAATLASEGIGISPILIGPKTIREALIQICQTFGGHFFEAADGRLTFGMARPGGSVPGFTASDMTQVPEIDPGSWTRTSAGVQVRFRNGDLYLNEDVVPGHDPANFSVTGSGDAPAVDRLDITDPNAAAKVANAMAQSMGQPFGSGTLGIRKSRIGTLKSGDRFTFSYSHLSLTDLPAIAVGVEQPAPGQPEVIVEWESDMSRTMAGLYVPPAYVAPASALLTPVLSPRQFGFEVLGAGKPDNAVTWFGFSAVQPTRPHNGFYIHREFPDASSDYVDQVTEFSSWTPELYLYGSSVSAVATTFEIYLGPQALLGGMLGIGEPNFDSFTASEMSAGLVFLALGAGGFGNPVEIVKVTALVPGGGTGRYSVTVQRGQWGTTAVLHNAWGSIGVQSSCAMFQGEELAKVGVASAFPSERFLLQPSIGQRRADIATLSPITIVVSVSATPAPANLRAFGDRLNPSYTTGQDIPIAWDATVTDLDRVDLAARTSTELDIYDSTNTTLTTTLVVSATLQSTTWLNASLVTALGSQTDFWIRAYQKLDGARSATYALLRVRKV